MPDQPVQNQPPRIIIDSDWKAQAQKEKERLAANEREAAAKKAQQASAMGLGDQAGAAPEARGGRDAEQPGMPPADFQALVGTLATQALMYLGAFPDPQTGKAIVSLEYARFHIDLLDVLEQKTRGNTSNQEADDLKQALNELRLRFVEIAKAVAQAAKEGRTRPASAAYGADAAGAGAVLRGAGGVGGVGGIAGPGL